MRYWQTVDQPLNSIASSVFAVLQTRSNSDGMTRKKEKNDKEGKKERKKERKKEIGSAVKSFFNLPSSFHSGVAAFSESNGMDDVTARIVVVVVAAAAVAVVVVAG